LDGSPTVSGWDGFTELDRTAQGEVVGVAAYKKATGSEGTSVTFTVSATEAGVWRVYQFNAADIGDWDTDPPEASTAVTGNSTTPDPGSLTPTWGAKNTWWAAMAAKDGTGGASAFPSSYTNTDETSSGGTGQCNLSTGEREVNATSEDPGTFTIASDQWVALTVAVEPTGVPSQSITPAAAAITVSAPGPTITTGAVTLSPAAAAITVTGPAPTVTTSYSVTPAAAAITVTAPAPTVALPSAEPQTLTVAAAVITVTAPEPVVFPTQNLTLGYDTARFYRLGNTRLALAVGLSRSGANPYRRSESWAPASGAFALPTAPPPTPSNLATEYVASTWVAGKDDDDATLTAAINARLTAVGYTRPDGSAIT
jgi:hypothetical protein